MQLIGILYLLGRLEDKVTLMCNALTAKAEILVKLADFHSAKNILLKAYKLKNPNKVEMENIEHSLKVGEFIFFE